ncbi:MAG: hypothetical protein PHO26_02800 [Dehalococcoidia bacterium]|nr:hypothetical protein [Dehalococcoidia bacterium]MDD5494651.1 hypothetical protein [Dehalococcoidia bacterium]
MTDLIKKLSFALLISVTALSLVSCSQNAVSYQPSGLPGLIAFSSDRDNTLHIYTVKPDSTGLKSTSTDNQTFDGLPMWSPDGARIAFATSGSGDYEICTMKEDGSDRKQITSRQGWDGSPRWSPDGSKIVFVGQIKDEAGDPSYEIFMVNTDRSNLTQLTRGQEKEAPVEAAEESSQGHSHGGGIVIWNSVPTWSPDGSKILFASNRDGNGTVPVLYIMNPDGSDQKKLGFPSEIDGTEPDWSPATNKIVFVRGTAAKGDIWVMDAGSPFPNLTAKKITDNKDNNRSPVWSPDGKQIAFVADTYGDDDIFIMNADGSNIRRVTYDKSNERHPTWR